MKCVFLELVPLKGKMADYEMCFLRIGTPLKGKMADYEMCFLRIGSS